MADNRRDRFRTESKEGGKKERLAFAEFEVHNESAEESAGTTS